MTGAKLCIGIGGAGLGLFGAADVLPNPWDYWGQYGALGILGAAFGVFLLKVVPALLETNRRQADQHREAMRDVSTALKDVSLSLAKVERRCAIHLALQGNQEKDLRNDS